jgi:hypothetical protein
MATIVGRIAEAERAAVDLMKGERDCDKVKAGARDGHHLQGVSAKNRVRPADLHVRFAVACKTAITPIADPIEPIATRSTR